MSTQAVKDDTLFGTYLELFAKTRSKEVSSSQKINFVSTDLAIDFFEKGKEIGEEEFKKKIKENIEKRMSEQGNGTSEIISHLLNNLYKANFSVYKMFVSINIDCSKILLSVKEDEHYSEQFMNMFYPLASELEDTYSKDGIRFHVSAIDESENINYELLKSDGYNFCYDLVNKNKVF